MSDSRLNLKVVTPSGVLLEEEDCEAVYSTSESGVFGVLPQHIPMMCPLTIGITKYVKNKETKYLTTLGGIFQIENNNVTILSDNAELGEKIDVQRAKAAQERAEAILLSTKSSDTEVLKAQFKLAKALARLNAALKK